jgi:hypothetical protein
MVRMPSISPYLLPIVLLIGSNVLVRNYAVGFAFGGGRRLLHPARTAVSGAGGCQFVHILQSINVERLAFDMTALHI